MNEFFQEFVLEGAVGRSNGMTYHDFEGRQIYSWTKNLFDHDLNSSGILILLLKLRDIGSTTFPLY